MPYDFEPRDFENPHGVRVAADPEDELEIAFKQWQKERSNVAQREIGGSISQELYELAVDCLAGVPVRTVDATSLLLAHRKTLTPEVGLFLTAAYNQADETVVFFDVAIPTPPKHLGYGLCEEKTLVLDAPVHSTMAIDAKGLIVNRTDVDTYFGYNQEAAFINLGSALTFGTDVGVAVNFGKVRGSTGNDLPLITVQSGDRHSQCDANDVAKNSELRAYLDDLQAGLSGDRTNVCAFLNGMDPSPRRAIKRDLIRYIGE